ncbi:MAG: hypothetical protein ACRDNM_00680 [Gaiellaceae bacterium]
MATWKKKMTKTEREEWQAFLEQMQVNADRTRALAEKAQAKLDEQAAR